MNALLEKAVARIRELPEERQEELAEIILDLALDYDEEPQALLTEEQIAEVELAKSEVREGKIATDEEMADLWRRFGR